MPRTKLITNDEAGIACHGAECFGVSMLLRCCYLLCFFLCPMLSFAAPETKKQSLNAKGKPNVLFILKDDLRDYIGGTACRSQARTPNDGPLDNFLTAAFDSGFSPDPQAGLVVGQSFGVLSAKDYPNKRPFEGLVHYLRITLLPPKEHVTKPSTH